MALFIVAGEPLRDGPNSHCEGGKERTLSGLEKYGLKIGDTVTMRDALEVIGVSDTVFSLPYVIKQSQSEAGVVLLKYMAYMFDMAKGALPLLGVTKFAEEMKAVEKRTLGHNRPQLLANANKLFNELIKGTFYPPDIFAMTAMAHLSSDKADNLAATHAGIALMDMGRAQGRREEVADMLKGKLRELIPASAEDKWDKL